MSQSATSLTRGADDNRPNWFARLPAPATIGIGIGVYCVIALLAYWPMAPLSTNRIPTCACGDLAQQVWFIEWTRVAILHGQNLFATPSLNAPFGINLADNTAMPFVGVIASPFTSLFGPIAATNLMFRLAFVVSAASMFFVVRTMVRSNAAAFLGGLLYGFSPYMTGQGIGHLNLLFVPLPPLIFLLLVEMVARQRVRPSMSGLALGVVCIAQFFISIEVLTSAMVMSVVVIVLAGATHPRRARVLFGHAARALGIACVVFMAVTIYPIYYGLDGPRHLVGIAQPIASLWTFRSDLLSPIVPTIQELVGPAHLKTIGSSYVGGTVVEDGVYLGLTLLVAGIAIALWLRRNRLVQLAALLAGVAFVFSLGPSLVINDHDTGILLPFDVFRDIPLLQSEVPARFSLYVQFAFALLVAVGLDTAISKGLLAVTHRSGPDTHRTWLKAHLRPILGAGLGALVLFPLVPKFPYATPKTDIPAYFSSPAVKRIPPGSVLLAYPYPLNPDNVAMFWQAASGMRFKLLGDYAITPGAAGGGTTTPPLLHPAITQQVFEHAMDGASAPIGAPRPLQRGTEVAMKRFLRRFHVQTIALDPIGVDPELAISYVSSILGPPTRSGGMDLWYDVLGTIAKRTTPLSSIPQPDP